MEFVVRSLASAACVDAVAEGREDYYAGELEAPGEWLGEGAALLELPDQVGEEGLVRLLKARDPGSGMTLRSPLAEGAVAGFDLAFKAPKSVSIVFGIAERDVRREVIRAHEAAVVEAIAYLERQACGVRRGRGDVIAMRGGGFVAAAFRHRTSRAGDPLLHTHVVVGNVARGDDGRWSALDGRLLYRHAKTAGFLYLLQVEQRLLRHAEARAAAGTGVAETAAVESALAARPSMSDEQRELAVALTRSGDGVEVMLSPAGTGKTYALGAAVEAWRRSGIPVLGCALSARAACELRDQTGFEATTIARLRLALDQGVRLAPGTVVLVDEAGMVGTRDLAALADAASAADAKLVLVGDDRQLPEIEAGGAFRALGESLGAHRLREVRRQHAYVMAQLGHTDPGFTLRVYAHSMRRDERDKERLRAVVEGRDWAPMGTGAPSEPLQSQAHQDPGTTKSPEIQVLLKMGAAGFEPATSRV
jgi:conjugative relaxase-like TrwC/TraI family protein